ncbi:hypothetical protein [Pseudoruegeria sp. HB172150]|uniref:hypothetical protein n=1 Tax=Pseudoruegeria sp. HB172150 TaxID=2721164 RepID=UPI00155331F8|nr:hypothetical protein [Pseudoruegeria sp. HB172150]
MKHAVTILALAMGLFATNASAACLVEYKARKGTEYVQKRMSVPDNACSVGAATPIVQSTLADQGMQLLAIVKVTPGG